MKKIMTVVALAAATSVLLLTGATVTSGEQTIPSLEQTLNHRQVVWLHALEWCESGGNPEAVNKKDRDGTPSYGLLQFKPGTFVLFSERYGIATTTDGYMDGAVQEQIVAAMIQDSTTRWHQQFPDCTKRLGYPPRKN